MKSYKGFTAVIILATLGGLAFGANAVSAQTELIVDAPHSALAGDQVEVLATVTANPDETTAGITIIASYFTEFGGVKGWIELARGVTDENGEVELGFEHRSFGTIELRVEQLDADGKSVAAVTVYIEDAPRGPQLYTSAVGISIPWLNASAVLFVVAGVWVLMSYVAFQLYRIGQEEQPNALDIPAPAQSDDSGAISLGVLIALAIPTIGIMLMIGISRNPLTHSNLSGPENYGRTHIAFLEEPVAYDGPGEIGHSTADYSGESLYFLAGCAGCHGLANNGGVGGRLFGESVSLREFTGDIRKGPKVMPGYDPSDLSDLQIEEIYEYLLGLSNEESDA